MAVVACAWASVSSAAAGVIDRAAVVRRHNVHFSHPTLELPLSSSTELEVLTVGNGELGFSADLTGLQSLNNSFHTPKCAVPKLSSVLYFVAGLNQGPVYTLSNWGWHTPDPRSAPIGAGSSGFRSDGTLDYVYENVSIASADQRPGKGNRTVPYQFNCANYNDPKLCQFWHMFPARVNLGQLAFVLPGNSPAPAPDRPEPGCDGAGIWCNIGTVAESHTDGKFYCRHGANITVAAGAGGALFASTEHSWKDAPFGVEPSGEIVMTGVTHGVANHGYFASSCDLVQWNNTFDRSAWCRAGTDSCAPDSGGSGGPAGHFEFIEPDSITSTSQTLDMYTGLLSSNWSVGSAAVQVETSVDSETDSVAARWRAPSELGLAVQLAFCGVGHSGEACNWGDEKFPTSTTLLSNKAGRLDLFRENGADSYSVSCIAKAGGSWQQTGDHSFVLTGGAEVTCSFELNCCVGPGPARPRDSLSQTPVPEFSAVAKNAATSFGQFWETGAMVDIAGNTADLRAFELERRAIQSAFLLRSQESGSIMPQESGLLYNSWTGKHHSEMRYWHQTWLPLWGHPELLAKSDQWFIDRLDNATSNTAHQGYKGARWGKMLGESNVRGIGKGARAIQYWESPNNINPGLVWHQPHVVYMSELEYRAAKLKSDAAAAEVLERLQGVVLETAAFIADFPEQRLGTGTNGKFYDLGPPLVSASEGEGPYDVWNPTYELTQFNFSLDIANQWLARLGKPRNEGWEHVRMNLAPLPVVTAPNGKLTYNRHQNCLPSVFSDHTQHCSGHTSHPALNGAMGKQHRNNGAVRRQKRCLPGQLYGVDEKIMNNTLHETLDAWSWCVDRQTIQKCSD